MAYLELSVPPKSTRIRDVASAAGVSTATVSRALSNPELLTEATRDTVFRAIQATGYRVNKAARNLRMQRAGAVLVLVPNLGNPFFSEIIAGLSEAFGEREYSVLVADSSARDSRHGHFLDYFRESRVDGMICLDGSLTSEDLQLLDDNDLSGKVVFACEWSQDSRLPSVRIDNAEGARLAVRHLYSLGHRKIAHVTGPSDNVLTHARRAGMLAERERLGLPARDEWIIRGDFSLASGAMAAHKILAMSDRPTAVFCASDQVAFGLMSTLQRNGVQVPQDISVVGFDDIELSEYYVPALTTIRQDRRTLGTTAARLLLRSLDGHHPAGGAQKPYIVDVQLVVRESTGPV